MSTYEKCGAELGVKVKWDEGEQHTQQTLAVE